MVPNHYLHQRWLIISKIQKHLFQGFLLKQQKLTISKTILKIAFSELYSDLPGANELIDIGIEYWPSTYEIYGLSTRPIKITHVPLLFPAMSLVTWLSSRTAKPITPWCSWTSSDATQTAVIHGYMASKPWDTGRSGIKKDIIALWYY